MLEKTLESPLGCKEIQPVHPKGNQLWIFIEKTDEAEAQILWLPDVKSWFTGKDPDAGKDWKQEEKGMTEDEIVGWHHRFDELEFEQAPGVCDGQGSLASYSPWGRKELEMTKQLNWTELVPAHLRIEEINICLLEAGHSLADVLQDWRPFHFTFPLPLTLYFAFWL